MVASCRFVGHVTFVTSLLFICGILSNSYRSWSVQKNPQIWGAVPSYTIGIDILSHEVRELPSIGICATAGIKKAGSLASTRRWMQRQASLFNPMVLIQDWVHHCHTCHMTHKTVEIEPHFTCENKMCVYRLHLQFTLCFCGYHFTLHKSKSYLWIFI